MYGIPPFLLGPWNIREQTATIGYQSLESCPPSSQRRIGGSPDNHFPLILVLHHVGQDRKYITESILRTSMGDVLFIILRQFTVGREKRALPIAARHPARQGEKKKRKKKKKPVSQCRPLIG